jgi:hypothetical protein
MESPLEAPKEAIVPQVAMNIGLPAPTEPAAIVHSDQIVGLVKDVMDNIEAEKNEIQEAYVNFAEMVFNAGDATGASKEALVNLLKLKSDLVDKKTRMLEMMMKVYNREGQGPKTIVAHQHNDMHVHDKRKLFAEIDKEAKNEK